MATEESFPVKVYIYDISKGLARALSQGFIGRQIDGVWHTGIVVYGQEFYFGGTTGIESCHPGGTILGQPDQTVDLGRTEIPFDMFMDFLHELSTSTFRDGFWLRNVPTNHFEVYCRIHPKQHNRPERYHLLDHNCNTFSNEVAQFLTGKGIPSHITSLPQDILNTPFGAMIRPFVDAMHVQGGHSLFPAPGNTPAGSGGGSSTQHQ